jgi:hypothetical protein
MLNFDELTNVKTVQAIVIGKWDNYKLSEFPQQYLTGSKVIVVIMMDNLPASTWRSRFYMIPGHINCEAPHITYVAFLSKMFALSLKSPLDPTLLHRKCQKH